ncbi:MAG: HupE/UreJ family protein [Armatimonadota bacterium]
MRFPRPLVALSILLFGTAAHAHDPNLSAIRWVRDGTRAVLTVTVHRSRLEAAEGQALEPPAADSAIRRRLVLRGLAGRDIPRSSSISIDTAADIVRWEAPLPEGTGRVAATVPLLPEDPRGATLFQEIRGGQVVSETLLTSAGNDPSPLRGPMSWTRWTVEGLLHIAGGWDHLCYILGLVLVARRLRSAFAAATGFTVAHSATLAATALGWIAPPSPWVEAAVALSIAAIAAEALWDSRSRNPRLPIHALGFGLVHGCAFAGGLRALLGSTDSVAPAVLGFNVGVEAGQAAIVLVSAPVLSALAARSPKVHAVVRTAIASGIGLAGLWWLGARVGALVRG